MSRSASPRRHEESSDEDDYERKYQKAERARKRYYKWLGRQDDKYKVWRNISQWEEVPEALRQEAADYAEAADEWLDQVSATVHQSARPMEATRAIMQDRALEHKLKRKLATAKGGEKVRLHNQLQKLQAVLKDTMEIEPFLFESEQQAKAYKRTFGKYPKT